MQNFENICKFCKKKLYYDLRRFDTIVLKIDLNNLIFQMTAKHGYVWFWPVWISKSDSAREKLFNESGNHVNCNASEMTEALEGHFSLTHGECRRQYE
jgi:hypothetical protein